MKEKGNVGNNVPKDSSLKTIKRQVLITCQSDLKIKFDLGCRCGVWSRNMDNRGTKNGKEVLDLKGLLPKQQLPCSEY